MRRFARLFDDLDATTSTNRKVALLAAYFVEAPAADGAWAVHFLIGRRPKRVVTARSLRAWVEAETGLPEWLVEDSYAAVGDLAETIALLLDAAPRDDVDGVDDVPLPLAEWIESRILPLARVDAEEQETHIRGWWRSLRGTALLVLTKLLTGGFRVGVSQTLVVRGLAEASGVDRAVLTHRLAGPWDPTPAFFERLVDPADHGEERSRPYPFFLASPLDREPTDLGPRGDWRAEWKWDGIRAQIIRRDGETHVWSRGEDLITERFPEIVEAVRTVPDGTALDGEILAWKDGRPEPFLALQRRIQRKTVGKKLLADVPCRFVAYDCLEWDGRDVRDRPLAERLDHLTNALASGDSAVHVSRDVGGDAWSDLALLREESRARGVEGLMLKRLDSAYGTGRRKGAWWKWKIDPLTVDAVLIYAQAGHGRRANLYTDYTFAVWRDDELVPIARAYSGLSDAEIDRLDRWIRRNTIERFGPVRSVKAEHVFEIAFEAIARSTRHRSGIAVRFPRILRWRTDKPAAEADRIETLETMLG